MMKKIFFVLAVLAAAVMIFASCTGEYDTYGEDIPVRESTFRPPGFGSFGTHLRGNGEDDEKSLPISYWQGLYMYVAADSVTPAGLHLSIINDSDMDFGYGAPFRIEEYLDGGWWQVPFINDKAGWTL